MITLRVDVKPFNWTPANICLPGGMTRDISWYIYLYATMLLFSNFQQAHFPRLSKRISQNLLRYCSELA